MYLSSLENNDHNKKLNNNSFSPNNIEFSLDIIKNVFFDNTNIYFLEEFPQDYFLKKSKKIYYFKIVKNKKRGKRRLKNNSKLHDKNSQYNIICKIKVYFTKSLLEHANKLYNKNQIDLIYAENENKDLIQFLEQNICTIYKEYISDEKSQIGIFKGFRKINDDLKYLKSKFNYDDDYIKEVKRISLNLEQIYKEKKIKMIK